MSDTEENPETGHQQNILLVISEDDAIPTREENDSNGYLVMRWTKDIIKRGACLTRTNIFSALRRLLEAFEKKPDVTLISKILLADEYDEREDDTDHESSDDEVPPSHTSEVNDTDEEIKIISGLVEYCNRAYKRFNSKAFEFDPEKPELRIAFDDVLDPSGRLRQLLLGHISDLRLSQDDSDYVINDEIQRKLRLDKTDPPKPCYYPSQEYAASAIIKRIRFILDYYHNERQLESFAEFDFRIYTARSNMLEEQTLSRLCDRRARCFPAEDYEDELKLRAKAKLRVRKYAITTYTRSELESLEQDVLDNRSKLFLIVADEAHWGISNSTPLQTTGANHKLVNPWDHAKHPNVVVLLVTATPWNLLTENSRLPEVGVAEASDDGRFVVVDAGQYDLRHKKLLEKGTGKDVTKKVGSVKELHVFKWTENNEIYFKKGLVLKLRVPQRSKADSIWLTLDRTPTENNFYSIIGTNVSEQAIPLLLRGMNGFVTVTTEDKLLTLTVEGNKVGFTDTDRNPDHESSRQFKVHMEHGEDIIELESVSTGATLNHLRYIYKGDKVELGQSPAACAKIAADATYVFLIDCQKQFDETEPAGPQYLSLNFYYNSIRNKVPEQQLIRADKELNDMFNELKPTRKKRGAADIPDNTYDDTLAAEYAYYVVLINPMRRALQIANAKDFVSQPVNMWAMYADERENKLKMLSLELEKQRKGFSISSRVFQSVVQFIENKAWNNVQKSVRSTKKNWSVEDSENFVCNLIGCLVHANCEKYAKQLEETLKSTERFIEKHIHKMDYKEMMKRVLSQNETFRIVDDLIQTEQDMEDEMNGHMKVIRATDINSANRVYTTLTLARKIGSEAELCFFEVIRYFDEFKISNHEINTSVHRIWRTLQRKECNNFADPKTFERCDCKQYAPRNDSIVCQHCSHPHNILKHFSDLDHLPCILIIVENGRMGDTFPPSFNVMDLRARHNSKPKLSSLQQEIGRLCRYQTKSDDYKQLPYVLVAPTLMAEFKKSLETSADFKNPFHEKNVDRYTRKSSSKKKSDRRSLKPNRKNYDFENETRHHNRLLLQAEPQIGKTGVFLKVISLLRQIITKQTEVVDTYSDEEDDYESDNEDPSSPAEFLADDWQFPYWETMAKDKELKKEMTGSKYDRIYGPYIHGKPPQYCGNTSLRRTKNTPKRKATIPVDNGFRMFSRMEHSTCTDCLSSATTILKKWKIRLGSKKMSVKISVPRLARFQQLVDKLKVATSTEEYESQTSESPSTQSRVKYSAINTWIFNPTYKRSDTATVNYHHSMICPETNSQCHYVQILVVRPEDFVAYCDNWQTTHAVLQLPDTLPGCEVDVHTGGIGYARRAIQMFAETLELDYIFLLDDNIYQISSVKFFDPSGNLKQTAQGGNEFEGVSLHTVLKQLESLFCCEKAPKTHFIPYENSQNVLDCSCGNSSEDLHFYTGPSKTYGVLGIRKFRPIKQPVIRSFRKTHVFSLVLLNTRALQGQSILYRPWPVREDCNLNNDCDDHGLYVCKFNRFALYKKPLKSLCCPTMYFWPEDVVLQRKNLPKATSAAETTLHWIRLIAPPQRLEAIDQDIGNGRKTVQMSKIKEYIDQALLGIEDLSDDSRKVYGDLRYLLNGLQKTSIGKSHVVMFLKNNPHVEAIHSYFQETNGIDRFNLHLVILPVFLCRQILTIKVQHFKEKIIDVVFDELTEFDVVTSHNITKYTVPFVILYIRGSIKTASDVTKIGNVGLYESDDDLDFPTPSPDSLSGNEQSVTLQKEKNCSKRTGSQDEDDYEHEKSPNKKMRPNAGQASADDLDSELTEANLRSITATNVNHAVDLSLSSIQNPTEVLTIDDQASSSSTEIQQNSEICSLDELRIYDRRSNTLRPLKRGAMLAAHEDVVLIAKPSGGDLSANIYEIISAEYNLTRVQ